MSLQFAFSKRVSIEPEMRSYMALSGISGDYRTIDANIKAIKYGSGLTLSSVTANLSTVNGTAFISNPSVDLRPYVGFKISFTDTAAVVAYFYGKAAGTGETYGAEKCVDPGFDNAPSWAVGAGWAVAGGLATSTAATQNLDSAAYFAVTVGGLHRMACTVSNYTSGTVAWGRLGDGDIYGSIDSAGVKTLYGTQVAATTVMLWGNGGTLVLSDASTKQVLTPSATGITGTSTAGGSTFNWADIGAGFNPNSATFTVTIERE